MPSTKGVSTRSGNATAHPGLAVKGKPRRSSNEVAAERQAKEEAKQKKARTKAAGIKRVAAYEVDQAEKNATDATPRAKPKAKPLTRSRAYANILVGSDDEMTDDKVPDDDFNPENEDTSMAGSRTDTETESVELMPKKRKVVENDATVKVDAPKPKIRDEIEEQKRGLAKPRANDDVLDHDLETPNPKRTRLAGPVTRSSDEANSDQGKPPLWRMPTLSDNKSLDAKPVDEGKNKGKAVAKGKAKATQRDGKVKVDASDQKSDTRVPPKSKSNSSNGKKPFLVGINDWATSELGSAKPASTKRITSTHLSVDSGADVPWTSASTRSSNSSVLSGQVMITTKVQPTGIQVVDGGLSDEDESMGVEREAAVTSPVKGKRRATSAAVVKVSSKSVKPVSRPKKLVNNNLPDGVELKTWRRSFVSTYMQYVGSLLNPWETPSKLACEKMQLIWDTIFPDIEYDVTSTSAVYLIAIQRVADSWRSSIGLAGIAVLVKYFESQDELRDSNENRMAFSAYALDKLRFLYQKADGDDKQNFRGLYRGAFVVQTFTAHFSAIDGAHKISGVDVSGEAILEARGALALSCTSIQRALTLIATGTLTIEMIRNAKGRNVMLPKTLNHSTGKVSHRQTGFNDVTWGPTTRQYVRSISKAYKKKPEKFDEIAARAKESAKKGNYVNDGTGDTPDGDATDEDNDLDEELVDISSSDEDASSSHSE